MFDDSKLWDAFAKECGPKAIGIVADLRRPSVRRQLLGFPNLTLQQLIKVDDVAGSPFLVAAGQLERKKGRMFGALVLREDELPYVLKLANERMGEVGTRATIWMIDTSSELKTTLSAVLADATAARGLA